MHLARTSPLRPNWRPLATALPLLLASCVQPPSVNGPEAKYTPLFPMTSTDPVTGGQTVWRSERCGYSATFTIPPISKPDSHPQGANFAESVENDMGNDGEAAACACFPDTLFPKNQSAFEFKSGLSGYLNEINGQIEQISKYAGGAVFNNDNVFDMIVDTSNSRGYFKLKLRAFSSDHCRFLVFTATAKGDSESKANNFITSARNLKAAVFMPQQAQPAKSSDVAQRLRTLKGLLDQQLITPVEYETKRKALVEGL